ncbi:universal stress protein [Cohnella panacarvi]|uniref:universal stress protein n=1 Tax=Cohnella panacarvi TaxID=400776 RepID=UPI00047C6C41|nr:universal stress protein [Cohnella panacarvi]
MNYHHILVAYDGSEAAEKALKHAIHIAGDKAGNRLTVAYVRNRPRMSVEGIAWAVPNDYEERLREYEDNMLAKAAEKTAHIPYASTVVLTGIPASVLLEYAEKYHCDLIVMGSRGLGAIKEWMLGSVSHHVVQQSKVPVLIVK